MELLSKDAVVIAAPAQNRDGYEHSIERMVPLLAARSLNRLKDDERYIDLWNSVGTKMDIAYTRNPRGTSNRAEYSQVLLEERYQFYEDLGIISADENRMIFTDDKPDFMAWSQRKIIDLVDSNAIYESEEKVFVCDACDTTLSVATEMTSHLRCHLCESEKYHISTRSIFFMDIDRSDPNIILPRKSKHISSHAANLPSRVAIERSRLYGTSLEVLGSPYVIDPKIGLALLTGYASELTDNRNLVIIQGQDTIYNIAPYTKTIFPELNIDYVLTANIPVGIDAIKAQEMGIRFFKNFLPIFALDRTSSIGTSQVDDLKREYENARAYIAKMRTFSDENSIKVNSELDEIMVNLEDAWNLIDEARIREGVVMIRNTVIKKMGSLGFFSSALDNNKDVKKTLKDIEKIYG